MTTPGMTIPGAATTLLGNIAGGARPMMGHDGAAQDALIAVPAGLFNQLINSLGGGIGGISPFQVLPAAGHGVQGMGSAGMGHPMQALQALQTYGHQIAAARSASPHDLVAVPAGLLHALTGQGGWAGQASGPYGQVPGQFAGQFAGQWGNAIGVPFAGYGAQYGNPYGNSHGNSYGTGVAPFQVIPNGVLR